MVEEIEISSEEKEEEEETWMPTLDPWVVFSTFVGLIVLVALFVGGAMVYEGIYGDFIHLFKFNVSGVNIEYVNLDTIKAYSLMPKIDSLLVLLDKAIFAFAVALIFASGYIFLKLRTSIEGIVPFMFRFVVPFVILYIIWPPLFNFVLKLFPPLAYTLSKMYYCSILITNWWVLPLCCFLVDLVFGYGLSLLRPETGGEIEIEQ